MTISNFLNPIEEEKEEDEDQVTSNDILQEVIDEHLGAQALPEEEEEENEDLQPQYTPKDALKAIQVLVECTETTENLPTKYIRSLENLEAIFKGLQIQSREQSTLDTWLR